MKCIINSLVLQKMERSFCLGWMFLQQLFFSIKEMQKTESTKTLVNRNQQQQQRKKGNTYIMNSK